MSNEYEILDQKLNAEILENKRLQARVEELESEINLTQMLIDDNKRMSKAGCKLSSAAFKVTTEYDGVHRLMLAVAEWAKAIAHEGGREGGAE